MCYTDNRTLRSAIPFRTFKEAIIYIMYNVRKIEDDIWFLGVNDRRIERFENLYPVPDGVSYNSYFISDEKTCLLDTVDSSAEKQLKENLAFLLGGRKLDYIVINHMEPDHSACLSEIVKDYPEATVVLNTKAVIMAENYGCVLKNVLPVKEGDTLSLGKHELTFVAAPMVHWPEVLMTYDRTSKILFSADAFGSFGSLYGHVFADEIDYKSAYTDEMRRYYTNIVGKYGTQVSAVLKKAATLEISTICPLHGFVWRKDLAYPLGLYTLWANYEPEKKGVLVCYSSIYGNTENAADVFAAKLCDGGVKNLAVYDVSKTDASYLVAEAFRYSHIAFFASTYNAGLFPKTEYLVNELISHNLKNRTFAFAESGSWAPVTANKLKEKLSALGGAKFLEVQTKINCALNGDSLLALENTANAVIADLKAEN